MEAITIIVSALVAGLTAGVTDSAKSTIKDLYDTFKNYLNQCLAENDSAKDALMKVEQDPNSKPRQEVLKEELAKMELEKNMELIDMAKALVSKLEKTGSKYQVAINDSQGINIGDNLNITQNFEKKPDKKKN